MNRSKSPTPSTEGRRKRRGKLLRRMLVIIGPGGLAGRGGTLIINLLRRRRKRRMRNSWSRVRWELRAICRSKVGSRWKVMTISRWRKMMRPRVSSFEPFGERSNNRRHDKLTFLVRFLLLRQATLIGMRTLKDLLPSPRRRPLLAFVPKLPVSRASTLLLVSVCSSHVPLPVAETSISTFPTTPLTHHSRRSIPRLPSRLSPRRQTSHPLHSHLGNPRSSHPRGRGTQGQALLPLGQGQEGPHLSC